MLLSVVFSCEENLEVSNPDALSPELVLVDVEGYESVLLSAYNRIKDFDWYGQNAMVAPEILADNLDFFNSTGRYEGEYVNEVRAHMERWEDLYIGINNCNLVITGLDELTDLTADEMAARDVVKGEALFIRALNYHDLARVYGYEPGQEVNGLNTTVPLRLTPTNGASDAFNTRPRATNTEMYDQLESDLTQAINLLPESNPDGPYRVDQAAAHALLARVYLYEGRWADAAAQAQEAMNKTSATLITDKSEYFDSWSAIPHPESIFESEIRSVDWSTVDGANNSMHSLTSNITEGGQFIIGSSAELAAVLDSEPGDFRDTIWTRIDGRPDGLRRCEKWQGEKGDFLENLPIIRYSEMMLIRAEGLAKSGNEGTALEVLNEFRAARGLPAADVSGTELTDLIMKERRLEFAMEGHRWFDLKRLGMDIPKSDQSTLRSGVTEIEYTDFRILADLPVSELNLNDQLVQNPGY